MDWYFLVFGFYVLFFWLLNTSNYSEKRLAMYLLLCFYGLTWIFLAGWAVYHLWLGGMVHFGAIIILILGVMALIAGITSMAICLNNDNKEENNE